jgi:anti-anti-sigma factor
LEIVSTQHDRVIAIAPQGSIDALTASEITAHLTSEIEAGHARIVLDLAGIDFMSSAGLRAILAAIKACRQQGGDLRVAAARGEIERTLKMSGFTSILRWFDAVDEAVASFNE